MRRFVYVLVVHFCVCMYALRATDDLHVPGLVLQDAEVQLHQFSSRFGVSEAGGGDFSYWSLLLLQLWSWTGNWMLLQVGQDSLPCCTQRDTKHTIKLLEGGVIINTQYMNYCYIYEFVSLSSLWLSLSDFYIYHFKSAEASM